MSYPFVVNPDLLYSYAPVLLVICPPDVDIDLDNLDPPCTHARSTDSRLQQKQYSREIIVEGMAFTLSVERPVSTHTNRAYENLFTPAIPIGSQTLGITLGQHLVGGRHMAPVNRNLLSTARSIGRIFGATGIIWCPARLHVDFEYFSEASEQYAATSFFPLFTQISTRATRAGQIETRGLRYFAGNEIRIQFPAEDSLRDWMPHMFRAVRALLAGDRLNESSTILHVAPGGAQLNHCHQKGLMLEISYAANDAPIAQGSMYQAALGAASRTF